MPGWSWAWRHRPYAGPSTRCRLPTTPGSAPPKRRGVRKAQPALWVRDATDVAVVDRKGPTRLDQRLQTRFTLAGLVRSAVVWWSDLKGVSALWHWCAPKQGRSIGIARPLAEHQYKHQHKGGEQGHEHAPVGPGWLHARGMGLLSPRRTQWGIDQS